MRWHCARRRACPIRCRSRARPTPVATRPDRYADVNGVRLHYLVAGKGDPVVLLHGYAQTSHMWRPLIAELAKTHTVIAPDLRGFGQSAKPDGGYDKKTHGAGHPRAGAGAGLSSRSSIVGHDIGLMVAYAYAAQYPDEVERIVLMDAFLPGVGDWTKVWLLRDLWHFHFYGKTPLKLVDGPRAHLLRALLERLRRRSARIGVRGRPPVLRRPSTRSPARCAPASRYFRAFEQDAKDFAELSRDQADDADAGADRREGRRASS